MQHDNEQVDDQRFIRRESPRVFRNRQVLRHSRGQKQRDLSATNSSSILPPHEVREEIGRREIEKGLWVRRRVDCASQRRNCTEKAHSDPTERATEHQKQQHFEGAC